MAWQAMLTGDVLSGVTTEAAFQYAGGDWKISLNPGESVHTTLKAVMGATDDVKFTVYGSNYDAPGAVPDAALALNGADWHMITEITVDNVNDTGEWQGLLISGYRWFAATAQRVGSTDAGITATLKIAKDGVNAS